LMQDLAPLLVSTPPGETLYLAPGTYSLSRTADIKGRSIVGAHQDVVRIEYAGQGYALDQMASGDSDGGRGYLSGFTLGSAGHGIRVFGDGHRLERLKVQARGDGVTCVLPIMTRLSQVYAFGCGGYGFKVTPHKGMIGTSLLMDTCWAYQCGLSGYHIETVAYSKLTACASQECGTKGTGADAHGFALIGNTAGEGAMPSITLEQIATEGDAGGFWAQSVRGLRLSGLKHVNGTHGPRGAVIKIGNVAGLFENLALTNPGGQATGGIGFLPDPNNAAWIWDSTGRDGSIVLLNSRVKVEPYRRPDLGDNERKRFSLLASSIL
jgi:hypothetical protein